MNETRPDTAPAVSSPINLPQAPESQPPVNKVHRSKWATNPKIVRPAGVGEVAFAKNGDVFLMVPGGEIVNLSVKSPKELAQMIRSYSAIINAYTRCLDRLNQTAEALELAMKASAQAAASSAQEKKE